MNNQKRQQNWFRIYSPRPAPQLRIICLPHAGGCASFFRQWSKMLLPTVELVAVQYPGREERLHETPIDCMSRLIPSLISALRDSRLISETPYILFGHSMGGYVAAELCRTLENENLPSPRHLILSACEAPVHKQTGVLHLASDEDLLAEVMRLNGSAIDFALYPELAEMVLPIIRNDYRLIECWQPPVETAPINTPITVFAGEQDTELTPEQAKAWHRETRHEFHFQQFPGDHFYLIPHQASVIQAILAQIKQHLKPMTQWAATP